MRYIECRINIRVRFSESDAMGVVWHGNYHKYFEEGREYLGKQLGMTYQDIYKQGFVAPIVKLNVNYKTPIHFGEEMEVVTRFMETKAAKVVYNYEVWNLTTRKLSCKGSTEQVFLNEKERTLELFMPSFFTDWLKNLKWSVV